MILPAITLWQPWACLVEIGAKPWETRSKPPPKKLIGQRVAIHAAARKMRFKDMSQEFINAVSDEFGGCHWAGILPYGVVVCTAVIDYVVPANIAAHMDGTDAVAPDLFGDYSPGRWAWKLKDVIGVHPHTPAKGKQVWGWPWTVPEGVTVT